MPATWCRWCRCWPPRCAAEPEAPAGRELAHVWRCAWRHRPRPRPQVQVAAGPLPKSQERAGPAPDAESTGTLAMAGKIDVDELRVGMFIHLDLSWMQHPFPRRQLPHHPRAADRQDPRPGAEAAALEPGEERAGAAADHAVAAPTTPQPPTPPRPSSCRRETAAQAAERERREQLSAQRASAELCQKPVRRSRPRLARGLRQRGRAPRAGAPGHRGPDARAARQDAGRRRHVHPPAHLQCRRQRQCACDERGRDLAADGPRLRPGRRARCSTWASAR